MTSFYTGKTISENYSWNYSEHIHNWTVVTFVLTSVGQCWDSKYLQDDIWPKHMLDHRHHRQQESRSAVAGILK